MEEPTEQGTPTNPVTAWAVVGIALFIMVLGLAWALMETNKQYDKLESQCNEYYHEWIAEFCPIADFDQQNAGWWNKQTITLDEYNFT